MKSNAIVLRGIADEIEQHKCRQFSIHITDRNKHRDMLTPNFQISEFACNDGTIFILIDKRMAELLQELRDVVNCPVLIISAYRNPEYNRRVNGSPNSQHLLGKAVDIQVEGYSPEDIAHIGRSVGFTGIGIYTTFTHLDVRDEPAEWRI